MWTQRFSKIGTYKGNYLKERWPWFSKDFDWGFFNLLLTDMQLNGIPERVMKNYILKISILIHSQYHSQLPGIRVRCFINEFDEKNPRNIK